MPKALDRLGFGPGPRGPGFRTGPDGRSEGPGQWKEDPGQWWGSPDPEKAPFVKSVKQLWPRSMQSEDILTPLLVNLISGLHPSLWLLGPQKATHSCFEATHSVALPLSLIIYILHMSPSHLSHVLILYSFSHCSIGFISKLWFWLCDTMWHYSCYGAMRKGNVATGHYRQI